MMPASQRLPHVLGGGVPSIQEPHILDAQLGESMAQLHLTRSPERDSPFGPHVIVPSLTARHINGGHLLTLIQQLNQVSRNPGLVVGMSHNQKHIGSETIVGPGGRLNNILRNCRDRQCQQECKHVIVLHRFSARCELCLYVARATFKGHQMLWLPQKTRAGNGYGSYPLRSKNWRCHSQALY